MLRTSERAEENDRHMEFWCSIKEAESHLQCIGEQTPWYLTHSSRLHLTGLSTTTIAIKQETWSFTQEARFLACLVRWSVATHKHESLGERQRRRPAYACYLHIFIFCTSLIGKWYDCYPPPTWMPTPIVSRGMWGKLFASIAVVADPGHLPHHHSPRYDNRGSRNTCSKENEPSQPLNILSSCLKTTQ